MKVFAILLLMVIDFHFLYSQVGIGTDSPHPSSLLHLDSSTQGLLIPNISLTGPNDNSTIPTPANGLLIFNTSASAGLSPGFFYWFGNQWNRLSTSSSNGTSAGWSLTGNAAGSADFFGTINYQNLYFKVNNKQIAKFAPNGGLSLGIGANANENQSIAIGENAAASSSVQSMAIGYNSVASGHQSTAIGYSSESSSNSSIAVGYDVTASGLNSTAIGVGSNAAGQNSTSIGYGATTFQANAIILGNHMIADNKVGIGTNMPDERLHVVGKIKMVDGSQANGYILTSDANGVATWKSPDDASNVAYAQAIKSSNTSLNSYDGISFGSSGEVHNLTVAENYIQTQEKTGIYRITYTVSIRKNSSAYTNAEFYLTLGGTEIPGTRTFATVGNGDTRTVTLSKLVKISSTYQLIRIMSNTTDSDTSVLANGTSLLVEFVK